jgi:hypothetical protein
MSANRDPIELAPAVSVQPEGDGSLHWREQSHPLGANGDAGATNRLRARAIYAGISLVVIAASTVDAFSIDYDLTRFGRAHWLWQPFVWEATSALTMIALLGLPRRASGLTALFRRRPLGTAFAFAALALAFSSLHIVGMVLLREAA